MKRKKIRRLSRRLYRKRHFPGSIVLSFHLNETFLWKFNVQFYAALIICYCFVNTLFVPKNSKNGPLILWNAFFLLHMFRFSFNLIWDALWRTMLAIHSTWYFIEKQSICSTQVELKRLQWAYNLLIHRFIYALIFRAFMIFLQIFKTF